MSAPAVYRELIAIGSTITAEVETESHAFGLSKRNTNALYSLRMGYTNKRDHASAAVVALEILKREVGAAGNHLEAKAHLKVLLGFVSILSSTASELPVNTGIARTMAAQLLDGCPNLPPWTSRYIKDASRRENSRALQRFADLKPSDWNATLRRVHAYTNLTMAPSNKRADEAVPVLVDLDVARNLSRIAVSEEGKTYGNLPLYDHSEDHLRVHSVEIGRAHV